MSDAPNRPRAPGPVFLERRSYRRRRLRDAARLLPLLGIALWVLPVLWKTDAAPGQGVPASTALIYVFGVWLLLVVCARLISARLSLRDEGEGE